MMANEISFEDHGVRNFFIYMAPSFPMVPSASGGTWGDDTGIGLRAV